MTDLGGYERYRLSGLWHVHTDRTDGVHSVAELVEFAAEAGFPLLGIVEHVRRELDYDFDALADRAQALAAEADLACAVGCEAKVLDADGRLDVAPATRERADVVYAAYHGTAFSREEYLESIHATLSNPHVDVWAHPWSYARKRGFEITDAERDAVLETLREAGVYYEVNLSRPSGVVGRPALSGLPRIVGYDLHDLSNWPASRSQSADATAGE
ncbi:MAG: PHP domain-containing protein [Haloarculaceae archaeon]